MGKGLLCESRLAISRCLFAFVHKQALLVSYSITPGPFTSIVSSSTIANFKQLVALFQEEGQRALINLMKALITGMVATQKLLPHSGGNIL